MGTVSQMVTLPFQILLLFLFKFWCQIVSQIDKNILTIVCLVFLFENIEDVLWCLSIYSLVMEIISEYFQTKWLCLQGSCLQPIKHYMTVIF